MVRCVCSKRVGVGLTDMSNHHTDKLHDIVLSHIIAVYNNVEASNEEYYMQSERENFKIQYQVSLFHNKAGLLITSFILWSYSAMQFGKIRTFFYIVNVQRKLVVVRRPSYIHHASVLLGCLPIRVLTKTMYM